MDERIKEGTFLALTASVACWVVKGAMLGCGKSLQTNYGIWERERSFYGGPQRDLKGLNMLLLHCLSKKNLCHLKLTAAFFVCICSADFLCWKLHVCPVITKSFFVMVLFLMLWIS